MDIDVRFKHYVEEHKLFTKEDKILVAVSGGKDSMLLLTLLCRYGVAVEVAHCNFNLRAEESDGDEQLVRDYTAQLGVPFHVQQFDTTAYAAEHKMSIQLAARELRYQWFETLRIALGCAYVAIAQHKNDHVETVLFNLSRGTGLLGLQGILPKRESILRPLLFMSSKEVLASVELLAVPFRDDSSNFSNKYARNKIRLDVIPEFEELNPDFVSVMDANISRFQETQQVLQSLVAARREALFVKRAADEWEIDKASLGSCDESLLYFLFEPYGFSRSTIADLYRCLEGESGRVFESADYRLLVDRSQVKLRSKCSTEEVAKLLLGEESLRWGKYSFEVTQTEDVIIARDTAVALLDFDKLIFPLEVRSWKEGDVFCPLGMKGKKKVSDFFIQQKIDLFQKKEIPIWLNGNGELLWVTNYRMDERYKITENTQKVLKLVCNINEYEYK